MVEAPCFCHSAKNSQTLGSITDSRLIFACLHCVGDGPKQPFRYACNQNVEKLEGYVDEAFFLGGVEKTKVLKAFKPHIFFDDQDVHLIAAAKVVPSGKVPYASSSELAEREAS